MKCLAVITVEMLLCALAVAQEHSREAEPVAARDTLPPVANLTLEASVVTEKAPPVLVKEDTLIYNAAAFRVAEDASLDEMIRKIPGMEVDQSGNVTLNGKEIRQLRVNGKRYFGDNVRAGIKNIPAAMVENLFAYDAPSDLARISGIDDGEEEPVLDVRVKKSSMDRWNATLNVGGGSSWRYAGKLNANQITKHSQQTVLVNARNLPARVTFNEMSRSQVGSGSSGETHLAEAGYSFSREKDRLSVSGSAHLGSTIRQTESFTRSETINATSSSFGASQGFRKTFIPDFNGETTLEWKRDKYLTLYAKAVLKCNNNTSCGYTDGRSFRSDPFETGVAPWDYLYFDPVEDPFSATRVNGTANATATGTSRVTASANLSVTKRSKTHKGLRVTFGLAGQYRGTFTSRFGNYRTRYYRIAAHPDSLLIRSNYIDDDNAFFQVTPQVSVNVPIAKKWSFQATLKTELSHYTQQKDYYDLATVDPLWQLPTEKNRIRACKQSLPEDWESGWFDLFSAKGSYDRYTFNTILNIARYTKKFTLVAGVALRPQLAVLHYDGTSTPRFTFDAAPNVVFKYRFTPKKQLEFYYRSWLGSPSVASMLPVTNGTNPLYVSVGNPSLRSPFIQRITLSYNTSNIRRRVSFVGNILFQYTSKQVSTSTEYDEDSGVRTSTPKNIDGNWRISGSTVCNKTFSDQRFSLANHLGLEYQHNVSFLYNKSLHRDETNVMGRMMFKERIEGSFRSRMLEVVLTSGVEVTDERSRLRPSMNQCPVNWMAGISAEVTLPGEFRLGSDFTACFQRGWAYEDLNRNYWIWNAEVSKSILRGKAFLRLGWYDILRSQDNLVRTFNQSSRSIAFYNGTTSYVLLRFLYKF